ncbi:MAG: hypothetical protein ACPL1F_05430 [bacterium]
MENDKIIKLQLLISEMYKSNMERKGIGITDIIRCPLLPKTEEPKVVIGNIVDEVIKNILEELEIDVNFVRVIEYKGLTFTIHPDGIDEEYIYEIKTSHSLVKPSIVYLLQTYAYLKFTNRKGVYFIFITPSGVEVIYYSLEDYLEENIDVLLDAVIERYKNNEPYKEICNHCFYRFKCEESEIRKNLMEIVKNLNYERFYVAPYALPNKGVLVYKNRVYEFERKV